ncbi:troponin I, fast skeletal muscle-like isoform X2 [Oncorhynchus keta]|uniref:troponin I, fast skeletal muscle-like isoform X2 n=1 Tax=Oncorhynchus keta TaxID=8018 RepID=UPI00227A9697|nr:troponin I, fast skeletal muscle-like isoform X2 [Oncorhynchus keta]
MNKLFPVCSSLDTGSKTKQQAKMSDKKMTASRRNYLKSLMLQIAAGLLEAEAVEAEAEKARYMKENCPVPEFLVCMAELTDLCKKLHQKIERVDEERYDMSTKVTKSEKEVEDLKMKVVELNGKFRKPVLKKVRMSADAMLQALLGSKHKVSMDLRSNLKQVKKEVKEEDKDAVGDWRKNIEDKSDRKKMFETHKE